MNMFQKYSNKSQMVVLSYCNKQISTTRGNMKNAKDHWHTLSRKKKGPDRALAHFDDFYKSIFRLKWPSVRLGLLTPQKYVALVNNFGDVKETKELLTNLGAMDLKVLFEICKNNYKISEDEEKERALDEEYSLDRLIDDKVHTEKELELSLLYAEKTVEHPMNEVNVTDETGTSKTDHKMTYYENDRIVHPGRGDGGSLQDFIPATKLKGMDDYVSESQYYSYYKTTTDVPIDTNKCAQLNYPEHWNIFSFDRSDLSNYPPPKRTSTGSFNYFLLDGASVLPVLALDVKPGDKVLDMCAAPGGKSLAILQTMSPSLLVCNDSSRPRIERINSVLRQFLYNYNTKWKDMLLVQQMEGECIEGTEVFDKILVDAPCTNDRRSLHEESTNIFGQQRIKERLKLPETQAALLTNALRLVKRGGTVVYSTCSISPVQNDGVVGMSLRHLWEEQRMRFTITDMSEALSSTSHMFNYGKNIGLKFGHLVVPFLPSNFGPMYFCKISKNID